MRAKEMAGKKEMACCVRGYHIYKDNSILIIMVCNWGSAGVSSLACHRRKNFRCKITDTVYLCKIFSYVYGKFFATKKKKRITVCVALP